ncbi:MAG: hypothetical protein KY462_04195 [Actinobacteria bacterium]|nr:hypothetical protein [Actinomycetota bacterium]
MSEVSIGYRTIDSHPEADQMIESMRQTGAWPAVQELRGWTRPWLEVSAGGAVLDVGCGLGEVLIDLAGTGIGARPVGRCGRKRDGRLRGLALRAGCEDVRVRGATAAIRMVARPE